MLSLLIGCGLRRAEFLGRFLDNLANWEFAESNLEPVEAFVATAESKDA